MDAADKILHRHKLGLTIIKIIEANKLKEGADVVKSLRKLAAASLTEYSIIQKITGVKKDPQFTTLAAIVIEGLGMSFPEFYSVYERITEKELESFQKGIERSNRKRERSKKAKRSK